MSANGTFETCRGTLFFGVDRKSSAHAQNGAFDPIATEHHSGAKYEDDDGLTDSFKVRLGARYPALAASGRANRTHQAGISDRPLYRAERLRRQGLLLILRN